MQVAQYCIGLLWTSRANECKQRSFDALIHLNRRHIKNLRCNSKCLCDKMTKESRVRQDNVDNNVSNKFSKCVRQNNWLYLLRITDSRERQVVPDNLHPIFTDMLLLRTNYRQHNLQADRGLVFQSLPQLPHICSSASHATLEF